MTPLNILYFSLFFTYTLAAPPLPHHQLDPSTNNGPPLPLRARVPPQGWSAVNNQPTAHRVMWGNYPITFWTSTAILPVVAAAVPLADFYRQAHLAIINSITSGSATNCFTFGLGALTLYVDTLDGNLIDWQMLIQFTSRMVRLTNQGFTGHYVALVGDQLREGLTVVALEAARGTARMWLNGGTDITQYKNDPFNS